MKALVSRTYSSISIDKASHWGKIFAITGGAQVLVQISALINGILVIRLLSTQEYALYTLTNTMLGTMIMLADNGISNGVMAEAGKVWEDKNRLGVVIATGLYMRKRFAIYTLLITLPILAYLLIQHNAKPISVTLILLSIIPAFSASLSDSLLEIPSKLHQDIRPLQTNQVEVNFGRLILNAATLVVFPFTFVSLIANGIPRIYGNYKLRRMSANFTNINSEPDVLIERQVLKGVKATLPIVVYHCISGQISIWLISLFGTSIGIAQLGALGRLSIIFAFFSTIFSTIVIPRFSRLSSIKSNLLKQFLLAQVITAIISLIILTAIWVFASQILSILGNEYMNLRSELLLIGIAGGISLGGGVCSQLCLSRGWFFNPYILIAINFLSTIVFLFLIDSSSLISILRFNIFISITTYFLSLTFGLIKIFKIEA